MSFPQKRSRLWTFLSLWAVFVLAAPQLLMACPMTGGGFQSTPDAACCCQKKLQSDSALTTPSKANSALESCCKKVPLPPSDIAGDSEKIALAKARVAALDAGHLIAPSTPALVSPLEIFEPQSISIAFSPPTFPSLISQQIPSSRSGRAPPI